MTKETAIKRNEFIKKLASAVYIAHAVDGGMLDKDFL